MMKAQFNIKLINHLKDMLLRLHQGEPVEMVKDCFNQYFNNVSSTEVLLIVHELKSGNNGITAEDVTKLFHVYQQLYGCSIDEWDVAQTRHPGHPVHVFKEENHVFKTILNEINELIEELEKNHELLHDKNGFSRLKELMERLGQFYHHYNRKEKLVFPILERYGHYMLARNMWADDDRIRTLYKGTKKMVEQLPELEFEYMKKIYKSFENRFKEMVFDEEAFFLPITQATFNEDDWFAVAEESGAYGFAVEPEEEWIPNWKNFTEDDEKKNTEDSDHFTEHHKLGAGYLTLHEVNHILNHLPLELTFVDRNGFFKYFNDRVQSSDMMFIRTPSAIGRNVANCHPPKSMSKVMQLIRDLKTKKRSSESMWFKKKDEYVHVTYKGVFDENGEYLGILEYVQDIQPFFELPREVKKEISSFDDRNATL